MLTDLCGAVHYNYNAAGPRLQFPILVEFSDQDTLWSDEQIQFLKPIVDAWLAVYQYLSFIATANKGFCSCTLRCFFKFPPAS